MISKEAELLHDKFCVIDFRKVITGSYNWTYKAAHNSENILILNDPSVATQYITRFEQQKAKYNKPSIFPLFSNKYEEIYYEIY
jgi:phosphatidylserine/phosphatidylglycerophosphate/cardiolipin synthase-like enzyme